MAVSQYYISRNGDTPGGYDAYETDLASALTDWSADVWSSSDDLEFICADDGATDPDDVECPHINSANWANPPGSITIKPVAAEMADADGWDTSKYILASSGFVSNVLRPAGADCDITVEGLQISVGSCTQGLYCLYPAAGHTLLIKGNILDGSGTKTALNYRLNSSTATLVIVNNIFQSGGGKGISNAYTDTGTIAIYHNTFYDHSDHGMLSAPTSGATHYVGNNLCVNSTNDDYSLSNVDSSDSNISEDASSPDGSSFQNKTITFDNPGTDFVLTAGTDDNDDAIGGGTDYTTDPNGVYDVTDDINGTARASSPTIGAWEAESGTTLTIQSVSQGQAIDSATLVQAHSLAVDDATQAQAIDNVALVQAHSLPVDELAQAQTIDAPALVQAHSLPVADVSQGQTIDNVTLIQAHVLIINELNHAQSIENATLSISSLVTINELLQSQSIDGLTLTQAHSLVIEALAQLQTIENMTITQAHAITIADLTHAQSIEILTLLQGHIVQIQDLLQGQVIDNTTVAAAYQLTVDGITQANILDPVTLAQAHNITIQPLTQEQFVDTVQLGETVIALLQGDVYVCSLLEGSIKLEPLLEGDALISGLLEADIDINQ